MFRLRTFGGLTLERDGVPYTGPATQRRRLAVLAVLAASDAGVSRDRLTDYLWPASDAARGRHSLDEALSGLRRELRSDALFTGGSTLRLNGDVVASDLADHADAVMADDADRAVALYAGPFLDGFAVPGAGEFERWADAERVRRSQAHARALDRFAAAAAARGDDAGAVRLWQARVALDPLDTTAALAFLGALAAAGNPAEALRAARVHEALVRNELDGPPGREWAAAVEGIRAQLSQPPGRSPVGTPSVAPGDAAPEPAPQAAAAIPAVRADAAPVAAAASAAPPTAPARRSRLVRSLAAAAVGVLLTVSVGVAAWAWRHAASPAAAPAHAAPPAVAPPASVAVLPFANTSGDPADAPFSDGLTDELIGALSRVPGVRVTGRTSAFALESRGLGARAIADTLGVANVIEGSVRRAGDRFRISVQLVHAGDNSVRWSGTYDRELRDVFAVQTEIARAVVAALGPTLVDGARQGRVLPPRDLATYELYLRGRHFWSRRTPDDLRRAADYFEQAVARDPTYADAYAGLADARVLLVLLADRPPRAEVPRARAAAATAIRLDSTLAEAHAAIGNIREAFDWNGPGADEALARAVALDPGYATAHLYRGIHLLNRRRIDEAIAELTEARTLDPLSAPVRMQLGRAHLAARRPDQAVAALAAAVELSPEFAAAHGYLGDAYLLQGRTAAALAAFRQAAMLNGRRDSAQLAYGLAATGDHAGARRLLGALLGAPSSEYRPPVPVAKAYVALGDADAAFRWLERGIDERAAQMRTIDVAPAFDPLRADRRWARLLRRVGLEQ